MVQAEMVMVGPAYTQAPGTDWGGGGVSEENRCQKEKERFWVGKRTIVYSILQI